MASSLQQLLVEEEAPEEEKQSDSKFKLAMKKKQLTPSPGRSRDEVSLPIFICRDSRSSDLRSRKPRRSSSCASSERLSSERQRRASESEPVIDGVAVKAVVSMLGSYIGRYLRDKSFRRFIRNKLSSCLSRKTAHKSDTTSNVILDSLWVSIDGIEKLVEEDQGASRRNNNYSNRLLSVAASLSSEKNVNGATCGVPNSSLSAFAQLYLSVVYKMEKNETSSARHLLQVFADAPFLARTHLLPDLWEHLFLPHLLHIKVWYSNEVDCHSSSNSEIIERKKKRLTELSKVYNYQMDVGTARSALYYKQWLKVGAETSPVPQIPLPSPLASRRRVSSDSYSSKSSFINKHLYQTVFGTKHDSPRNAMDFKSGNRVPDFPDEEHSRSTRRSSSQSLRHSKVDLWPEIKKLPNHFPLLPCRTVPIECSNIESIAFQIKVEEEENGAGNSNDLNKAISTICCSDDLTECEAAIHSIARAKLNPNGSSNRDIEASISKSHVIEGMLEVLFASEDDEVLELAVSLLAETVAKNEMLGQIVLNSDPQLEIFLKLLRRTSVFLKASVLLYLLKPKAKQMTSTEWVPLVLRVLEFGDHSQTLFAVRCLPRVAALYLLEQLLLGFNEDKNLENGREVVSVGGLGFLIKRIEVGNFHERSTAATITLCCIRADGSCRNYIAENLNKSSLLELLLLEFRNRKSSRSALYLLIELLCLGQRKQIMEFLKEFGSGYGGLNTKHILLVRLMRASAEERPLVAAILLQLDLRLGDCSKCSLFREEAIEAIAEALDCQQCNERVQEKSARALMMLGGRFSRNGEAITEQWLLQKAGFEVNPEDTFYSKDSSMDNRNEDEEETKIWLGKAATALLKNRDKRFLIALSDSIADGVPVLARASLVTISWLSSFLHFVEVDEIRSTICALFIPRMLRLIGYDNALEDRVLASLSLLNLSKSSGGSDLIALLNEESIHHLRNLSLVTWTANELVSIISTSSRHQQK